MTKPSATITQPASVGYDKNMAEDDHIRQLVNLSPDQFTQPASAGYDK